METNGFWARLREARAVQGLLVYLGATWLILQLLDIFIDNLGLPSWTMIGAIVLLSIGLVIQLAVVWVQAWWLTRRTNDGPGPVLVDDEGEPDAGPVREAAGSFTWARFALGGIFGFAMLFGLSGAYVLFVDVAEGRDATFETPDGASPAVAVLPFAVSGAELEELGEGMMNLLATNLDGVGGLRAIDSRTVLARWDELVGDRDRADRPTNLSVARASGARYALLGSADAVGADVRLQADIYDLSTGERLDHRQIEGAPDSLLQLVDGLSIEVMDVILGQAADPLPSLSVASVTTTSIPALKAYLDGEACFRNADFEGAKRAYERAIAGDSLFALAHYQLANAWGWTEGPGHPAAIASRRRAVELADRLPARQALLVQATDEVFRGRLAAIDKLRSAVAMYPDDAEAWYLLGDAYFHLGSRSLASLEEIDAAFRRAVEIEPRFAPYRIHLLDLSFPLGDSAEAFNRIRAYGDLAPGSRFDGRSRLQFALAFGGPVRRREAEDRLDAIDSSELQAVAPADLSSCCWHARETVLEELVRRGDRQGADEDDRARKASAINQLASGALSHGQVARGLALFDSPEANPVSRTCSLAFYQAIGYPLAGRSLDDLLAMRDLDGTTGIEGLCLGVYAGQRGRWADVDRAIAHYDSLAASEPADEASRMGPDPAAYAESLRGFELWKRGHPEAALPLLREAFEEGAFGWWLGPVYEELGRDEEAARFYAANWRFPVSYHSLGRVLERLGRREEARRAYETFVAAWDDADPEMQPWVDEAVAGILRTSDRLGP